MKDRERKQRKINMQTTDRGKLIKINYPFVNEMDDSIDDHVNFIFDNI